MDEKEDEEFTSFITPFGTYCFQRMAEGLRNAGTTFIRMTSTVLKDQIPRNLLAYVDDLVVKSKKRKEHIKDLQETFGNIRKANLKLNPEKCTFGVRKGKILGCIVSAKGIDPNPEKIQAILNMEVPRNIKDIQKLIGRLAALNRFISKSAERSLPIFQALKGIKNNFAWEAPQQKAFEEVKKYLATPETLATPEQGSELLLYVSTTEKTVSAVLIQEQKSEHSKKQVPDFFASEALSGSKIFYSEIEKIAYAVLMASRKLKRYFQAHKIRVPTNHPLKEVLQGCRTSGRLGKWAAELSQFYIDFEKRTAIKSQVLADFVADWTPSEFLEETKEIPEWTIYCDGAWGYAGAGAAAIITSPSGIKLKYAARLEFKCTNNIAEYKAVLLGLRKAKALGIQKLILKTDSQVVARHIEKDYKARDTELAKYLKTLRDQEKHFDGFTVKNISRNDNMDADEIAKAAAQKSNLPPDVFFRTLTQASIKATQEYPRQVQIIESEDWRAPIMAYLRGFYEPENEAKDLRMKHKTRKYKIINNELYKEGICQPLLKCISTDEGKNLLSEIHEGICGAHAGARAIAGKAFRQGFYWPSAQSDSKEVIIKCDNCQLSANREKAPGTLLQTIEITWP